MLASCWGGSKHFQHQPHMAHQAQDELLNTLVQLLNEQGIEGIADGIRLLVNEAMRQERRPRTGWIHLQQLASQSIQHRKRTP